MSGNGLTFEPIDVGESNLFMRRSSRADRRFQEVKGVVWLLRDGGNGHRRVIISVMPPLHSPLVKTAEDCFFSS